MVSINYLLTNYNFITQTTDIDYAGASVGCSLITYILLSIIYLNAKLQVQREIKKRVGLIDNGWVHDIN